MRDKIRTMTTDYSVRRYQPGDEEEIAALLELVFDGWPSFDLECSSLDHWKWKYLDNPLKFQSIVVGISGDKIIGCDHNTYANMYIQNKTRFCSQGTDAAVHPEYRKIGVYSKIAGLKNDIRKNAPVPLYLSYWTSDNPFLVKNALKRDHPHFESPYVSYIRIKNLDLHTANMQVTYFTRLLKRLYISLQIARHGVNQTLNRISYQKDPNLSISQVDSFDMRINGFFDTIRNHYNFIIEKKQEYLNWRYCDPRGGKYTIKIAEKDNDIVGYMVLRINKYNDQYHEGHIVDVLFAPNQRVVFESLLVDALDFFDESDVNIIYSGAFRNSRDASTLHKYGFFSSRNDNIVFLSPFASDNDFEALARLSPEKIHYTYGSSDGI